MFQVVLDLLLIFEFFYLKVILLASLITFTNILQYALLYCFRAGLLLFLSNKNSSLLRLHEVLIPNVNQLYL